MEKRRGAWISAGTLIESRVIALSLNVLDEFDELLSELSIRVAPSDERQAEIAIDAYMEFWKGTESRRSQLRRPFAYALAKLRDEPLLFKGDQFSKTDIESAS
jgi:ribonuclease VapC